MTNEEGWKDAILEAVAKGRFSKSDSGKISVEVSESSGKAVVSIRDNAGGIPEAIRERIFDPYFTTKDPGKGTGIGLYIAKTIIEKNMQERLTARNSGEGAEFRIEI
ncbi:MAG: HAMP domain-containing sensor histidine kinase [Thermodesulfovibrionales bacterium]